MSYYICYCIRDCMLLIENGYNMWQHHTAKTSGNNCFSVKSVFLLNNQASLHEDLGHLRGKM